MDNSIEGEGAWDKNTQSSVDAQHPSTYPSLADQPAQAAEKIPPSSNSSAPSIDHAASGWSPPQPAREPAASEFDLGDGPTLPSNPGLESSISDEYDFAGPDPNASQQGYGSLVRTPSSLTTTTSESALVENSEPDPNLCAVCGSDSIEREYAAPLCAPCRTKLVNRPVPIGIRIAAVAALVLTLFSCTELPHSLHFAIADKRGVRAEERGDFATATREYLIVTKEYPDYNDGMISLVKDSFKAGDYQTTAQTLDALKGRELEKSEADEVNGIGDQLEQIIGNSGGAK